MNVLMLNGSPHKEGNTYIALCEAEKIFKAEILTQKFCISEIKIYEGALPVIRVKKQENVCFKILSTKLL